MKEQSGRVCGIWCRCLPPVRLLAGHTRRPPPNRAGRTTVYAANGAFSRTDHAPESTYLARWSLRSGQLLSVRRIGGAGLLAVGLSSAGALAPPAQLGRDQTGVDRPAVAAISPDGHAVAVASHSGTIIFIDTRTGEAHNGLGPSTSPVTALAYSPDNRAVVTAANNAVTPSLSGDPRSRTSKTVLTIPVGQVQPIAFSPRYR